MGRLRLLLKILRHGERGYFLYKAEELVRKLDEALVPFEELPAYINFAIDVGKEAWAFRMLGAVLRTSGLRLGDFEAWRMRRCPDTQIR